MTIRAITERLLVPAIVRAGFNPVPSPWSRASENSWSFSNGRVRLDLHFANQTGELALTLEHPEHDVSGVPLSQLFVRESDPDLAWTTHGLILCEPDRAKAALTRLANAIDRNASSIARLTVTEVSTLYETWLAAGRADVKRRSASRTIAAADAFWHQGNYGECARLLAQVELDLSPAQQKRLDFAKRKAQRI